MIVKPIIFLDFDGVINTPYVDYLHDSGKPELFMPSDMRVSNRHAINLLNWIHEEVPFNIVVTSTWRLHMTVPELKRTLQRSGLHKDIDVIGVTPNLLHVSEYDKEYRIPFTNKRIYKHTRRGHEIYEWLRDHAWYEYGFVILDDDADMWIYKKQLIQTEPNTGITFPIAYKVLQELKEIQEAIQCRE